MERASEEKTLAGLAHVAAIFGWVGVVANIVLFVLYREKSQYVTGHVKQGLGLSVIGVAGSWLLGLLGAGGLTSLFYSGAFGAAVGMGLLLGLLGAAFGITVLVLGILAAIKGFKGEEHRYPLFGEFVAKIGE